MIQLNLPYATPKIVKPSGRLQDLQPRSLYLSEFWDTDILVCTVAVYLTTDYVF